MNLVGLSFNGLPPISVPFRFFLTAIIFAMVLSIGVFIAGDTLWSSRWHPMMLALVHGFTLGIITPIMMGAILQMLPVVGGVGVKHVKRVASICHIGHFVGSSLLMSSFLHPNFYLKLCAMLLLFMSFSYYLYKVFQVLVNRVSQGDSFNGIRYSVLALLITLIFGFLLQSQLLGSVLQINQNVNYDKAVTNLHALWGGLGWMGLLIFAVSLQIIPMFHVAPNFPKLMVRFFSPSVLFLLVIFTLYNLALLRVLSKRKRKVPDVSILYWQFAAVSFLLLTLLFFLPRQYFPASLSQHTIMLLVAIFMYGYVLSVIQGMLLKILPFLAYTHLQQRCLDNFENMTLLPKMNELLNKKIAKKLFYIHIVSGLSLVFVIAESAYYWLFASLFLIEFSLLCYLMTNTWLTYMQCNKKMG
jgi:hypothetical protein